MLGALASASCSAQKPLTDPTLLVAPITLEYADTYDDGGTIGGVLVDASRRRLLFSLDGRIQTVNGTGYPWHTFIGAMHPSDSAARALPPWGPGERALLESLHAALLTAIEHSPRSPGSNSAKRGKLFANTNMYPRFLRQVDSRLRVLRAVQRGEATDATEALTRLEMRPPIVVDSIRFEKRASEWHYVLEDSAGSTRHIRLGEGAGSRSAGLFNSRWLVDDEGTIADRAILAATSLALRDTTVTAAEDRRARVALQRAVQERTARILATDRARAFSAHPSDY